MEADRAIDRPHLLTTWLMGLLGIAAFTAVILGLILAFNESLITGGSGADVGRFALAIGLSTFVSVLLVGAVRMQQVVNAFRYSVLMAVLHVGTFVAIYVALLLTRLALDDPPSLLEGTLSVEPGPSTTILAIMCVAAIAASMLALGATPTEDERATGSFG